MYRRRHQIGIHVKHRAAGCGARAAAVDLSICDDSAYELRASACEMRLMVLPYAAHWLDGAAGGNEPALSADNPDFCGGAGELCRTLRAPDRFQLATRLSVGLLFGSAPGSAHLHTSLPGAAQRITP